jgi:hypothetical protein
MAAKEITALVSNTKSQMLCRRSSRAFWSTRPIVEKPCANLWVLAAGRSAEIRPACELFPACFGAKSACETPKGKEAWNMLKAPIPDHNLQGIV